jgi:F420-dependent oxidoreductase-like protein
MRLRLFVEPQQGATYEDQLGVAQAAERLGFDGFFRSDHYLAMGTAAGLPGPTDAWLSLAGIARETSTIRLGTLVTSATFRSPGQLAIEVAQVDQMSGGRVELGIGAGWYADEHHAYALDFLPTKQRFDRLEEQLAIITGLWATGPGATFDFDGAHYQVANSPGLPKPRQQPRPPIIMGGAGAVRTPALAARYADEFNSPFLQPGDAKAQFDRVAAACEAVGRDPGTMRFSSAVTVCCAADEAGLARRAESMHWRLEDLRTFGVAGTPAEVLDRLGQWGEAGAELAYLQILDMGDLEHLELLAAEVLAPLS